ncbi:MAG: hypothetical protein ACREK5_03865 [Gemmatimonadota bacterium]
MTTEHDDRATPADPVPLFWVPAREVRFSEGSPRYSRLPLLPSVSMRVRRRLLGEWIPDHPKDEIWIDGPMKWKPGLLRRKPSENPDDRRLREYGPPTGGDWPPNPKPPRGPLERLAARRNPELFPLLNYPNRRGLRRLRWNLLWVVIAVFPLPNSHYCGVEPFNQGRFSAQRDALLVKVMGLLTK